MVNFKNIASKSRRLLVTALISVSVLSCGSESLTTAGISGTGIVVGVITGFGSIFVNGVKYDTDEADFNVDGDTSASQANLRIGMLVKLSATNNGDGTGKAVSVIYDDAVEGPVANPPVEVVGDANSKQFTVLGQSIKISATSTSYENVSFSTIAQNDVVEISGFVDMDNNEIIATRVEKKGVLQSGTEVELRGEITALIANTEFTLNGITIDISGITASDLDDLDNGLANGLLVEVEGIYQNATLIQATKIEGEDDLLSEDGEISLQGIITSFTSGTSFEVNGIPVDATAIDSSITNTLVQGLQIEVEGELNNGVLIADELEIRSGDSEFKAQIKSVNQLDSTIGIGYPMVAGEISLTVNNKSKLEDEQNVFNPLLLSDLTVGMEVKIEAITSGSEIIVKSLKRDNLGEFEIEGVATAKSGNNSFTIQGLDLAMDASAKYEINRITGFSATDFFNSVIVGTTEVELEDDDQDGLFDKAEID